MFAAITAVAVGILIVYWAVMAFVPVPGFGPGRFDSLRVFGANAILAFSLSQIIGAYSDRPWPLRRLGFTALHSVIPSAPAASLAYAALNLALLLVILTPLYRRQIFLRI